MISKKYFLIGALFGLVLLVAYLKTQPDGRLHIFFCNVGQGDAIFIRMPDGSDMLIDGGPDERVLGCLGRYMPFYDRTIDLAVLTHPENDHMLGFVSVLDRYEVMHLVIGTEGNDVKSYKKLVDIVNTRKIPYRNLYTGDSFALGNTQFNVLWPERNWMASKLNPISDSDRNLISQSALHNILGLSTESNLNEFSIYLHLKYFQFDVLFTGDGDINIQDDILNMISLPDVDVLKFPHHGSKTGMLASFLDVIKPEAAVISSGRNPWGHPTREALNLLSERKISILRTDKIGDIHLVSNGKSWYIK